MKRMSREGLRTIISIGLRVQPGYVKTILTNTHVHDLLVEDITNRVMGDPESETVVLKPSMVGSVHSPRRGKWDIDEPHPCPDLPSTDHS